MRSVFDSSSFNGKSYRLTCRGLDKEIEPKKSKVKVKKDRIVVMLKKVPGSFACRLQPLLRARASHNNKC